MGFGRREWLPSMPETNSAATDESAPSDLISFLKVKWMAFLDRFGP